MEREDEMDAYLERALAQDEDRTSSARDVFVAATDGFPLAVTLFSPSAPKLGARVVVINSAMAVPRRYYAPFARFLAASGLRVVTYDYRGIGDSRTGPVGEVQARLRDWGERDFAAILEWVGDTLGDAAPAVVGHSVGGQIVGLAANNARVAKLLLVGAQSGDWRLWPAASRAKVFAFWYGVVFPVTGIFGYLPPGLLGGEAVPGGVAREWAHWARRPGYMVGGKDAPRRAGYARLTAPIVAYSFDDDDFAPRRAVDALLDLYRSSRRTHRRVAARQLGLRSIGHFGFFRQPQRQRLWIEAREWLTRVEPDRDRAS